VQALALQYPPPGDNNATVTERIRYRLKNELQLMYRHVLESQKLVKSFHLC